MKGKAIDALLHRMIASKKEKQEDYAARLAFYLSLCARAFYDNENSARLKEMNELIHRLLSFIIENRRDAVGRDAAALVTVLIEQASKGGCETELIWSCNKVLSENVE